MSTRTFWAASLVASCALIACAQEPLDLPESDESRLQTAVPAEATNGEALAASGPSVVAYCSTCTGLIASTGNLYFTGYSLNEFGPDAATFHRTGKTSSPGSEGLLYRESGDRSGFYYFGSVIYANPGTFFGYFVANYNDFGVPRSQIKRVPLAGGSAVLLGSSPSYIGLRDLVTDGSTLYWADAGGIRAMSIAGGTIRTLVSGSGFNYVRLDGTYVYFTETSRIGRVPKVGGTSVIFLQATELITALHVDIRSGSPYVYWGERNGAVRSSTVPVVSIRTWQAPMVNRSVTSVGFDGTRTLWIDCSQPGNSYCSVRARDFFGTRSLSAGVGARGLQWAANSMYWMGGGSILRYVH